MSTACTQWIAGLIGPIPPSPPRRRLATRKHSPVELLFGGIWCGDEKVVPPGEGEPRRRMGGRGREGSVMSERE